MPPSIWCGDLAGDWLSPGSSPVHRSFNGPPSPLAARSVGASFQAPTESGTQEQKDSHQSPAKLRPYPVKARMLRERLVAADAEASKGSIAQLQEFVQGSKQCPLPANCSILQWSCELRTAETSLEFRAKVAFLIDGIPHHVMGIWQTSKLRAKRDAAERAVQLFVVEWGTLAEQGLRSPESDNSPQSQASSPPEMTHASDYAAAETGANVEEAKELARFCRTAAASGQPCCISTASLEPRWSHTWADGACKAFVEIELLGVPHIFQGRAKTSLVEACRDTARRVLWYLQCSGFEHRFEPDLGRCIAKDIGEAPANWMQDSVLLEEDEKEAAEKKTVLMLLQNRLQQNYARQIEVGQKAIHWSYERNDVEIGSPSVRATAYLPAADKIFTGDWQKSQREAQIDASSYVYQFLDMEFPSTKVRSSTN